MGLVESTDLQLQSTYLLLFHKIKQQYNQHE